MNTFAKHREWNDDYLGCRPAGWTFAQMALTLDYYRRPIGKMGFDASEDRAYQEWRASLPLFMIEKHPAVSRAKHLGYYSVT